MTSRLLKHVLKEALHCFLFAFVLFLASLSANAQTGTFTATGSMTTARLGSTATLLTNGKVLLTGGQDSSYTALSNAELYDPATGTFTATGSMITARGGSHTATLLPNGKVLLAGGLDGSNTALSSAELYDPATGVFTATGSMSTPRYQYTATLLSNGKVLMAAGCTTTNGAPCQILSSAELYDPATGIFTPAGSVTVARCVQTATVLADGTVLLAGGLTPYSSLASAEVYDPATGIFSATGSMITARNDATAELLSNGEVLVAGGGTAGNSAFLASAELYDPMTRTFSPTGSMAVARIYHTAALLSDGEVLVAGGANSSSTLASAEVYDPMTGTFSITGSMTASRDTPAPATLLPNGTVLVAGGLGTAVPGGANAPLASADLYTSGPKYQICLLYDQTRSVKSGAAFPIKLYLCDMSGNDLSSSGIVLHATHITGVSSYSGPAESTGNANPDSDFRFDSTIGATGGYIFNLGTSGLAAGTYSLHFVATGDSTDYVAMFGVR